MKLNQFFIIEKHEYDSIPTRYTIYKDKMFGLQEAIRNKIALETLNTPDTKTSYHLQEVKFSEVQEPLILTKEMEVKEEQSELPFWLSRVAWLGEMQKSSHAVIA